MQSAKTQPIGGLGYIRSTTNAARCKLGRSRNAGRKPCDALIMFKYFILQKLYSYRWWRTGVL